MIIPQQTDYISMEVNIIKEFFELNESQLKILIEKKLSTKIYVETDTGEEIEIIGGLNSQDYDIDEIFQEVMPTYQRQATLITLWSILEHNIEAAYEFVRTRTNASTSNIKRKETVSRVKHSLTKLRALSICNNTSKKFNKSFTFLEQEVRHVRHAWAHYGGKIKSDEVHKKLKNKLNGIEIKSGQLSISKEYIEKVIEAILVVSEELNDSIQEKILV